LFLESTASVVGSEFTTDLVLVAPDRTVVTRFEVTLAFDSAFIEQTGLNLSEGWVKAAEVPSAPGTLVLGASTAGSACRGPGSCTLATITWRGLSEGETGIRIASARLDSGETSPALPLQPGHALVTVSAPAATVSGDSGLSAGDIAVLIGLGAVVAGMVSGITWFLMRIRRRAKRRPVVTPGGIAVAPDWPALVHDYLSDLESAGAILGDPDPLVESMARATIDAPRPTEGG